MLALCAALVVVAAAGAGCGDKKAPASAPAAPPFSLEVPPGFNAVAAEPPLLASWEGPAFANGFVPTINVMSQPRPAGNDEAVYREWRDGLLRGMQRQYVEARLLDEMSFDGGRMVAILCQLSVGEGKRPMPLYAYGVMHARKDRVYTVGALTAAELDAETGIVKPIGEAPLLDALKSFTLP